MFCCNTQRKKFTWYNIYVICFVRITIVAQCDMDLRLYPMDTQHCALRLESCKYGNEPGAE